MAISIYGVLMQFGGMDQDDLAERFTRRHANIPDETFQQAAEREPLEETG